MLKVLFRDGVHIRKRENFITVYQWIGKSKDKYNCQDKAVPVPKSEQALLKFNSKINI